MHGSDEEVETHAGFTVAIALLLNVVLSKLIRQLRVLMSDSPRCSYSQLAVYSNGLM